MITQDNVTQSVYPRYYNPVLDYIGKKYRARFKREKLPSIKSLCIFTHGIIPNVELGKITQGNILQDKITPGNKGYVTLGLIKLVT